MAKRIRSRQVQSVRKRREQREEAVRAVKHAKNKKALKFVSVFVAAAVVVALIAVLAANVYLSSGAGIRNQTAAQSDDYTVDGAMMSFFIYDSYNSFLDYYGTYVSNFGLDTSKSLKTQQGPDGEGTTWYDYFVTDAKATIRETLSLCEAAKKAGVTLTSEETAAVADRASMTNKKLYGRGVKTSDIEKCMTLLAVASKYKGEMYDGFEVTDGDIDTYYEANKKKYDSVAYKSYAIKYGSGALFADYDSAKAAADKLALATDSDNYNSVLKKILEAQEMAASKIETAISGLASSVKYSDTDIGNWLFGAAVSETHIIDNTSASTITVYMVTSTAAPDTSATVDVRNILLSETSCGTLDKAKTKANELLEDWKVGEANEASFAKLARLYSADFGSVFSGGLYRGVIEGKMVENFDAWCFDEERKAGDCAVVSSAYGYHVLYFIGAGEQAYRAEIITALMAEKYDGIYDTWTYGIGFTDDVLEDIPA